MGYVGLKSGMSAELIKLVGLVTGFFVSFKYYQQWGDVLAGNVGLSPEWASANTLAFLVILVYLLVTRLLRLSEKIVQVTFAKQLNQVGGGLVGLFRGVLVASVILVALLQIPAPYLQDSILKGSVSGKMLSRTAPMVYDVLEALPERLLSGMQGKKE